MESLKIVPRTSGVLAALEAAMPSQHHRKRFGVQLQAEGAYLVALLDGAPVGHVLLRWRPIDPTLIRHGISARTLRRWALPRRTGHGASRRR